jgi:hypothetical protein
MRQNFIKFIYFNILVVKKYKSSSESVTNILYFIGASYLDLNERMIHKTFLAK